MMETLIFMAALGIMGAADNLFHHELTAKLPARRSARLELLLHGVRNGLYGVLYLGLAWWAWQGAWAWALAAVLLTELAITLIDFVEEDRTRRLPPSERLLHTVLTLGYGIFLAMIAPTVVAWATLPTAIQTTGYGWISWVLSLFSLGALAWGVRDTLAALRLRRLPVPELPDKAAHDHDGQPVALVTGATGFIGSHLVKRLAVDGWRVLALTRDPVQARQTFGASAIPVDDLRVIGPEARIDAVINLAGSPVVGLPWTARRRRQLRSSRLGVTGAVVDLIRRLDTKPAVLISASAVGYYGLRGPEPLSETASGQDIFLSRLCQDWEAEAGEAAGLGVRCVMARFGLVLGRGGGIFAPLSLAARFTGGARLGNGDQMVSWVHIGDAIDMLVAMIDQKRFEGPVNVTAPRAISQRQFNAAIAAAWGRTPRLAVPERPMRAVMGEMAQLLLDGQNAIPEKATTLGFRFRYPTIDAAVSDLTSRPKAVTARQQKSDASTSVR